MVVKCRYFIVGLWVLLAGCSMHGGHSAGTHPVDVLNGKAREWRYRDLDSAEYYAHRAYSEAGLYVHGRTVACNMLGFVSFVRMEYEDALYWYELVEKKSGCELERFVADVGRMNVYQREAENLAFYDCRAMALKRLAHINEESENFSVAEQRRLQSAVNDLHMVSALHHYMMGQRPEAYAEMSLVIDNEALRADSAQWLMYTYIKGLGLDVEGDTREQRLLRRYTYLNNCLRMSRAKGYRYFEGLASSGLSDLLADSLRMAYIAQHRPGSFASLTDSIGEEMDYSLSLARHARWCLDAYGDRYGVLNATIQMASLHNRKGECVEALNILEGLETGLTPDAQARMHEEVSVAYAGLGDKAASDHHRNLYLDILDTTRQDKEAESRYLSLQQRGRTMKVLLFVVMVGAGAFVVLLVILSRRKRQHGSGYEQRLHDLLHETEKRVYLYQRHIEKGKRDNIMRRASLSMVTGMIPYIDRMAHEVERLQMPEVWNDSVLRNRKLEYVAELADEINSLNELLACWIQTKQGMVRLTVETFPLSEVFDIIERGAASFAMKELSLEVRNTKAVVKADKALTFFMLNTLADNARKFTPQGGTVIVEAEEHDGYVEISVTDNGVGMSREDVGHILHEKVYDASTIGQTLAPDWRGKKGSGFGLLNCKGIIDKYRKTDALFDVCRFGVESREGEGSRFWFRLPKGVKRVLTLLYVVALPWMAFPQTYDVSSVSAADSVYSYLLERASAFADSVYFANVEARYDEALVYADSAFRYLNEHHRKYATEYIDTLSATRGELDVEIRWWLSDYAADYHLILDVRNELAVANLALSRLEEYRYNNRIYNDLYKLVSEDRSLIDYSNRMQRYYSNISVAVLICLLLVVGYLIIIIYAFMGRVERAYRNIESVEDDERRVRHEENRLHVQNMVLDNCLSVLKHETVYYPNRIKQLVNRLADNDERHQMGELIAYYRMTFATLVGCASRQLDEITFRRSTVGADVLLHRAAEYHAKHRVAEMPEMTITACDATVMCDEGLVDFLIEQLIDASLSVATTDRLQLTAQPDGRFVRFSLVNASRTFDDDVLHALFYPSRLRMVGTSLQGTEYIICRQIVREHDAHFNHIGCRIKAETCPEGYVVWFTLPCPVND